MKNKKTLILLIVIIALAVVIVVLLFKILTKSPEKKTGASTGITGVIEEGWDDGIDNGSVEESEVQIPGYTYARMKEGDTTLHLSIGNPKENDVGLFAQVVLEDGTVLYESELLKPGSGIEEIPLSKQLKKGSYNAYVVYQIVSLDEEQTPMNAARSGFTLYVD